MSWELRCCRQYLDGGICRGPAPGGKVQPDYCIGDVVKSGGLALRSGHLDPDPTPSSIVVLHTLACSSLRNSWAGSASSSFIQTQASPRRVGTARRSICSNEPEQAIIDNSPSQIFTEGSPVASLSVRNQYGPVAAAYLTGRKHDGWRNSGAGL